MNWNDYLSQTGETPTFKNRPQPTLEFVKAKGDGTSHVSQYLCNYMFFIGYVYHVYGGMEMFIFCAIRRYVDTSLVYG